jgi:hypothetical protein
VKIPGSPEGTAVTFYISANDAEGYTKKTETIIYKVGTDTSIPGFPWESIIIGVSLTLLLLYYYRIG